MESFLDRVCCGEETDFHVPAHPSMADVQQGIYLAQVLQDSWIQIAPHGN